MEGAECADRRLLERVREGVRRVPGDGALDFAEVRAELRPLAYSGWRVVEAEQDPAKAHPLTYARMGHDGVTRALAAAGL